MEEKKKVLIITYYWPPSGGAGVQRWLKFAKYLPDFNWVPIIYTPSNPETPVDDESLLREIHPETVVIKKTIWEPYSWYKRLLGQNKKERVNVGFLSESKKPKALEKLSVWIRGNLFVPDARRFWIRPSVKFLTKYIQQNNIDVVISTGPPHSMHLIALKLKEKLNIKWLADFRDPWTNIDYYKDLLLTKTSDKKHKRLEKRVLENADYVVAVSKTMASEFEELGAAEVDVITNGYDTEDVPESRPKLDDHFSLVHIGSINKDRNHPVFIKVLDTIVNKDSEFKEDLRIKLIGKVDLSLIEAINESSLKGNLIFEKYISHDKVIIELMKARLLYLPINNSPNAAGIVTGKIFEYLAAQRPILAIGPPDGDIADMLNETGTGEIFNFNDFDNTYNYIVELYSKFKEGRDKIADFKAEKYSRERLTKRLSILLNRLYDD